jgi:TFIIF-interacting CTD phosphatase-like protein
MNGQYPSVIYQCFSNARPSLPETDKTLVLDIDETLVRTWEDFDKLKSSKILSSPEFYPIRKQIYMLDLGEGEEEDKLWGFKRPKLDEFLSFASEYFAHICVWSAGTKEYVEAVCEQIFHKHRCPDIILTRDACVHDEEKNLFKPLEKFYELFPHASPETTIMIDDRDDVMSKNPDNGIVIPPYEPSIKKVATISTDDALDKVMNWLSREDVAYAEDIRLVDKDIF